MYYLELLPPDLVHLTFSFLQPQHVEHMITDRFLHEFALSCKLSTLSLKRSLAVVYGPENYITLKRFWPRVLVTIEAAKTFAENPIYKPNTIIIPTLIDLYSLSTCIHRFKRVIIEQPCHDINIETMAHLTNLTGVSIIGLQDWDRNLSEITRIEDLRLISPFQSQPSMMLTLDTKCLPLKLKSLNIENYALNHTSCLPQYLKCLLLCNCQLNDEVDLSYLKIDFFRICTQKFDLVSFRLPNTVNHLIFECILELDLDGIENFNNLTILYIHQCVFDNPVLPNSLRVLQLSYIIKRTFKGLPNIRYISMKQCYEVIVLTDYSVKYVEIDRSKYCKVSRLSIL